MCTGLYLPKAAGPQTTFYSNDYIFKVARERKTRGGEALPLSKLDEDGLKPLSPMSSVRAVGVATAHLKGIPERLV